MLQHDRFEELLPSVYRVAGTPLSPRQWVEAGRLSLPADARASHHTRLLDEGLEIGPLFPLHFTIARDHHLAARSDRLFLHRTVSMPTGDDRGVSLPAAVVGTAATRRLLDVVAVIDWLAHRKLLKIGSLRFMIDVESWRPGAEETDRALRLIDPRARSIPESEVRALLVAAGLPRPEVNADVHADDGTFLACGDLVYRWLKLLLEYEGRQHALDTAQFQRDIHRYGGLRREAWAYAQITAEMKSQPVALVRFVHGLMVDRGFDGPAPHFGDVWSRLLAAPAPYRHRRSVDSQPFRARNG